MSIIRNRALARVTAPASEPLTLAETKLYLRVDSNSEDSLLSDLIVSARMIAEHWLKRSLITQSWKISFDEYAEECITLPMGPVNSITSITIIGRDGSSQLVNSNVYYLNAAKNMLMLDSLIVGFRIEIIYNTGYGDGASIPKPIKQGLLSHIAAMYDNRGEYNDQAVLPAQSLNLYMPFREICL